MGSISGGRLSTCMWDVRRLAPLACRHLAHPQLWVHLPFCCHAPFYIMFQKASSPNYTIWRRDLLNHRERTMFANVFSFGEENTSEASILKSSTPQEFWKSPDAGFASIFIRFELHSSSVQKDFPSLHKLSERIANHDMIAERLAIGCKCKQVARHLKCGPIMAGGTFMMPRNAFTGQKSPFYGCHNYNQS